VTTKNDGVCARRWKVVVHIIVAAVVIFIVADYVLLRLGPVNVKIGQHLKDAMMISIAVSALIVSLSQALFTRKYSRLSVKPELDFAWNLIEPNSLVLYNGGLGTAIVTELRVAVDDNHLEVVSEEQWEKVMVELGVGLFSATVIDGKTFIKSGSSFSVFKDLDCDRVHFVLRADADKDISQKRMHIEVTYRSALEKECKRSIILASTG